MSSNPAVPEHLAGNFAPVTSELTVGNMKALFAQKALYSSSPILPQAAFPALPARGGAAGPLKHSPPPRPQTQNPLYSATRSGGIGRRASLRS